MTRVFVTVRGRVQGVGFRWFVRRSAQSLDLAGWVRNEADGSVTLEAEGEAVAIAEFIERLGEGPPGSRVDDVSVQTAPPVNLKGPFAIR